MRRGNKILCDGCRALTGDITPYGMKIHGKEKMTGIYCSKCRKNGKHKK